jgi:hypothetical protein
VQLGWGNESSDAKSYTVIVSFFFFVTDQEPALPKKKIGSKLVRRWNDNDKRSEVLATIEVEAKKLATAPGVK